MTFDGNIDLQMLLSLASEYAYVFHYDLQTDCVMPCAIDQGVRRFPALDLSGMGLKEAVRTYIELGVYQDDREMVKQALGLPKIMLALSRHKTYRFEFRSIEDHYCECKISYVNGNENEMVIGVANMDREIRARKEAAESRSRDYEIINALASAYSGVDFVRMSDGSFVAHSIYGDLDEGFQNLLSQGLTFSEAETLFAREYVYEKDRERYIEVCTLDHLRKVLRDKKSYYHVYRFLRGDEIHYASVTFVKTDPTDQPPTYFVAAYSYDEQMVLRDFVDVAMMNLYESIYFLDLENNIARCFKEPEESKPGFFETGEHDYMCRNFAPYVEGAAGDIWAQLGDRAYIDEYFATRDILEFTFRIKGDNTCYRSVWQVADRKDNRPTTMIVSIMHRPEEM